jgi:hypothetical protein
MYVFWLLINSQLFDPSEFKTAKLLLFSFGSTGNMFAGRKPQAAGFRQKETGEFNS